MAIISVSIPDKLLSEIDKLVLHGGFRSRSELIRAALEAYIGGLSEKGTSRIIVVISNHGTYPRVDMRIMEIAYRAREDLLGLYHQVADSDRCVTVIVLREGASAGSVTQALRRLKGVMRVEVIMV